MDRVIPLHGAGLTARGAAPGARVSTRALPTRLLLLEDEALARLAARGSGRAFSVLYERYQQPLYTYCYLFLHDADDAYDALQSALTRALAALRDGERDEAFRPWLFRLANKEAHAVARARAAEEAVRPQSEAELPWVDEPAEERARLALLVADLRQLPELQRSALLMRELTGLSHQEIATALGITRMSARQAIFHARRSLEDFREGRNLVCEEIRRMLSHEDSRLLRRHVVRAHLRECAPCKSF